MTEHKATSELFTWWHRHSKNLNFFSWKLNNYRFTSLTAWKKRLLGTKTCHLAALHVATIWAYDSCLTVAFEGGHPVVLRLNRPLATGMVIGIQLNCANGQKTYVRTRANPVRPIYKICTALNMHASQWMSNKRSLPDRCTLTVSVARSVWWRDYVLRRHIACLP